jgi:type IV secretory pathway TraG/TraD family ATPase VirD4
MLVMAPAGSGKTMRVVVPNVLLWQGPAVITSVKSDVWHLTRTARDTLGWVKLFDPTGVTGESSVHWSPLLGIASFADAQLAAEILCDCSKRVGASAGVNDEEFWDAMSRRVIAPMLLAAAMNNLSIAMVPRWLQMSNGEDAVSALLLELGQRDALVQWQGHCGQEERLKSSVQSTAMRIMEAWGRIEVADTIDITTGDVFEPTDLLNGGWDTLYLVAPAAEQEAFTPIFEALTNTILRGVERAAQTRLGAPIDPPLLLMLDEAANIAPIRRLPAILSRSRGEGLTVVSVWQDEAQLETIYGPLGARSIKSNSTAGIAYLPGINDHATLRRLSDAIGEDTYEHVTINRDRNGNMSRTISPQQQPVAPISWLRMLPENQVIVISGSHKPMRLVTPGWWEDPHMAALIDPEVRAAFNQQYAAPTVKGRR